jgi:hypothetical protein
MVTSSKGGNVLNQTQRFRKRREMKAATYCISAMRNRSDGNPARLGTSERMNRQSGDEGDTDNGDDEKRLRAV